MIYLILCFFIILVCFAEAIINKRKLSQWTSLPIVLILVVFASIRHQVGIDWPAYFSFYRYGADGTEIGFAYFNDLFYQSGFHFNFFLLFLNLISLILIFFALKDNSKLIIISLLLFYCELYLYFNFSAVRQSVAISITLFSNYYLRRRNFLKFLACIMLAMTFHVTAGIFLIAYIIPLSRLKKRHYFILISFFILFSIFIFSLLNIVSGDLGDKLRFYLELQEQEENIKSLFIVGVLKRAIILVLIHTFGKNVLGSTSIQYYNLYFFGFGLYISTYLISPDIGVRLSSYFLIFDIILAGNLVYHQRKLYKRVLLVGLFSIISLYKISTYMKIEEYEYNTVFKIN